MNRKVDRTLVLLLVLFCAARILGLHALYHQDEFKTVSAAHIGLSEVSALLLHPPLEALLFRSDAIIFGADSMRALPLLFGILSALLLFVVVRRRFDETSAFWSLGLYAVSFYGIWSSLMIDVDGAVLPTFFLAALYAYDRAQESSSRRTLWLLLLTAALIIGLLVKLSFVLVIGVLVIDALVTYRTQLSFERLVYIGLTGIGFVVLTISAFFGVSVIDPYFSVSGMLAHASSYTGEAGRALLQVLVQTIKAVYYLSPLLLAPLLFLSRDRMNRLRPFLLYIGLGLLFYLVLFDFSQGALDKYLMFLVAPLSVLAGTALAGTFSTFSFRTHAKEVLGGVLASGVLIALNFLPQAVVPLYPKTAWFSTVLHGHLNVLTPFNGGSGPAGFYVSFLFIATAFALSISVAFFGLFVPRFRSAAAILILCVGVAFNLVFVEEFAFGKINGSVQSVLQESLAYLSEASSTVPVLTYNDIGAYELTKVGAYVGRFYAAPQFEEGHRQRFAEHAARGGSFLVVGIPPLYEGFYTEFLSGCTIRFTTRSRYITGTLYDACKPPATP